MINDRIQTNGHAPQAQNKTAVVYARVSSPDSAAPQAAGEALRCGIYYRVSTGAQVEAYGYDVQRRLLPEHCERMGWRVVGHYEEPGESGTSLFSRPAMLRLLEDAKAGKFDVAVAIEEKRFSRGDMLDWGYIVKTCEQAGVRLATPDGIFFDPASPGSRMLLWVKGGMGEDEIRESRRRMMQGKQEAVRKGHLPHGTPPYGYRFQHYGRKRSEKRLVIHDEEARIVRFIFHALTYGIEGVGPVGTRRLARHLTEVMGVASPTNGRWCQTEIGRLLRNPVYRGEWAWREQVIIDPDVVPPLVTPELWQQANDASKNRSVHGRGRPALKHPRGLLNSFLTCAHCGYNMTQYGKPYSLLSGERAFNRAYVCAGRSRYRDLGRACCENPRWNSERLEAAVWEKLVDAVKDPELLLALAEEGERDIPDPVGADPGQIERSLAEIDGKIARVKAAYRNGLLSMEEFEEELGIIRGEREGLEDRLTQAQRQVELRAEREAAIRTAIDRVAAYRKEVEDPGITADRKRVILEGLAEGITLDKSGNLLITLVQDLAVRRARVFGEKDRLSSRPAT